MRSHTFLRIGLLLLVLALLLPAINHAILLADEDRLDGWQGLSLKLSLGAFAIALALSLFEKIGLRVAGARCRDCKRRIPHGHAWCFDCLTRRRSRAQEREHWRRA